MIISVASGKGGTGKTTVATNLALSLEKNVQLLDCDVEEPNSFLFVHPDLEKTETVYAPVPEIDSDKCTLCKKCVDICRFRALTAVGETILTFPELCHGCGGCMAVCPEKAVSETGRELGVVETGRRNGLEFVHGRLRIGEAMSPPLIEKVRSFSIENKTVIIDAPPGTSCPVIAAMKDTDFILLVTEPTPFGLHDLKLAVEAVNILGIPCGLVINRSDIGDDSVKTYAAQKGVPVLMEIPFDRRIAEVYSKGQLVIEKMPAWKARFLDLFQRVEKIVSGEEA